MPVFAHRLGRRPAAFLAMVMALFLLAVSQLSPGNAGQGFGPVVDSPVVVAVQISCGHEHDGDRSQSQEYKQGDAWTPAAAPIVRPPADTIGVLLPGLRALPAVVTAVAVTDATPLPGADPAQPGVLRI
jgi:hypothetical protein